MKEINQLVRQLNDFLLDVVKGGFARPEVADRVAFTFFGYRGPWYTVGYHVGRTIEQRFGRKELIECMRDYRRLLARYNEAAAAATSSNTPALWSDELLATLSAASPAR